MEFKTEITLALAWLMRSGIQNAAGSPAAVRGGINAWYDTRAKSYPFVYSEASGYFINLMVFLARGKAALGFGRGDYLSCAERAAGWLTARAFDKRFNGFRCRFSPDKGFAPDWICSFDNAIIANALLNLYELTGKRDYRDSAVKAGAFICARMLDGGTVRAKLSASDGCRVADDGHWSRTDSPFQLKTAAALQKLRAHSRSALFAAGPGEILRHLLSFQEPDGSFIIRDANGGLYFHPVLYALEGLYILSKSAGLAGAERAAAAHALDKALDWLFGIRGRNGIYSSSVILAQFLRLAVLTGRADRTQLRAWAGRLVSFQARSGGRKTCGGFRHSKPRAAHINSWATMMAVQALLLFNDSAQLEGLPSCLV